MSNRRKPKVVIPNNRSELSSLAQRVVEQHAPNASILFTSQAAAAIVAVLSSLIVNLRAATASLVSVNEKSQESLRNRNGTLSQITDILIVVRDTAIANAGGDRQAAGACGFEVIQTNSRDSRHKVVIPRNADQFLALAERVVDCTSTSDDMMLAAASEPLTALIVIAKRQQNDAIVKREQWQFQVGQVNIIAREMTESLRQLRDIGFAAAGPRNYELVSTIGFVVQSSQTQDANRSLTPQVVVGQIAQPASNALRSFDAINGTSFDNGSTENVTLPEFEILISSLGGQQDLARQAFNDSLLSPPAPVASPISTDDFSGTKSLRELLQTFLTTNPIDGFLSRTGDIDDHFELLDISSDPQVSITDWIDHAALIDANAREAFDGDPLPDGYSVPTEDTMRQVWIGT